VDISVMLVVSGEWSKVGCSGVGTNKVD
jgi:hypothetical protein